MVILGDLHLTEDTFDECLAIVEETCSYGSRFKFDSKGSTLVFLGDWFDKKHPSAKEYYLTLQLVQKIKESFNEVYFLTGNHCDIDDSFSNVDFLRYFGISVTRDLTIPCEGGDFFFGHFMTNQSIRSFGEYKRDTTVEALSKYVRVFLGHQHDFQEINKKIVHLGSARYVSFGERSDLFKQIAVLPDYINNPNIVEYHILKSPYNVVTIDTIEALDELESKGLFDTKVRFVFKDFEYYKENVIKINEYKDKFKTFKQALDFKTEEDVKAKEAQQSNDKLNFVTILNNYISSINNNDVIKELKDAFKIN